MKNRHLLTRKENRPHRFFVLATALFLLLSFSHNASATMIGDWDVQSAPISASMNGITNGFINGWLNTTYTPITIQEALSGPNILDSGIANLSVSSFQLTFESGSVQNNAGDDLVLFDARYDAGYYTISSSYDGYTSILPVAPSAFLTTGETRDYYLQGTAPTRLFPATIYGAAIDLSLLGIPDGAIVSDFRIMAFSAGCDFIGMGSLSPASTPSMNNPEPATMFLFGAGLAGFGIFRRKFAK